MRKNLFEYMYLGKQDILETFMTPVLMDGYSTEKLTTKRKKKKKKKTKAMPVKLHFKLRCTSFNFYMKNNVHTCTSII